MTGKIKSIILDFDGIVLESVDVKTDSFKELFSRYTDRLEEAMSYHLKNNGVSRFAKFKFVWENLLSKKYDSEVEQRLGSEFSAIVFDKVVHSSFVYGAEDFLIKFSKKVPIFIASATPMEELLRIIKAKGIEGYFAGIYGTPYKKADVIKDVIKRYKASANEIIYIGDSVEDWRAASSEGVRFIGRRNKEDLDKLTPYLFDNMHEIGLAVSAILATCDSDGEFADEYLRMTDALTARYHSRAWFSTFTASKNWAMSGLYDELHDLKAKRTAGSSMYRTRFPAARFFAFAVFRTVRVWARILLARILFFHKVKKLRNIPDIYLLRTWFFPASIDPKGNFNDRFFGKLPDHLRSSGKAVAIMGGVFSVRYLSVIRRISSSTDHVVFPQEYFIGFLDPVRVFLDILTSRTKINGDIFFKGKNIAAAVEYNLNKDFAGNSFENLMAYYIAKNLAKRAAIKNFILIYDNNPWEKMTIEALKEYSPDTKIVGYQHTIVTPARLSLMLTENEKKFSPLPHRIVTNGAVTREILVRYGNWAPERLSVGCALRFDAISCRLLERRSGDGDVRTILVALLGVPKQSADMINFAYRTFAKNCKYRIIMRFHPGLPIDEMRKHLVIQPESFPGNFIISDKQKPEDDLARSDILMYDQSSVCLSSLLMGVPAIHIKIDKYVTSDPLFECIYLKGEARDGDEALRAVDHFFGLSDEEFRRQQLSARKYVESYLLPPSEERLKVFF